MKTIIVNFMYRSDYKTTTAASKQKLVFNSEEDLSEGDELLSQSYPDIIIRVIKVLDKAYKYVNTKTGDLSDHYTSTALVEVKELKKADVDNSIVYFQKLEE